MIAPATVNQHETPARTARGALTMRFSAWPLVLGIVGLCGAAPGAAHAACTVPNQLTNGQTADASQVMANFNSVLGCVNNAPAGSTNALQYNAGNSTFGAVGPLTDGQVLIGSTGNAPQAAQLAAGPGIAIANAPGSITISESNSPYTPPKLANFTWANQPSGSSAADTSTGLVVLEPTTTGTYLNWATLVDSASYPTTPFTVVLGVDCSLPSVSNNMCGLFITDGTKFVVIGYDAGVATVVVDYFNGYTTGSASSPRSVGFQQVKFFAIKDDGTNFTFYAGADLNSMIQIYTASRTAWLSTPTAIGFGVGVNNANYGAGLTAFDYTKTAN